MISAGIPAVSNSSRVVEAVTGGIQIIALHRLFCKYYHNFNTILTKDNSYHCGITNFLGHGRGYPSKKATDDVPG